jgi:hypothetical protein
LTSFDHVAKLISEHRSGSFNSGKNGFTFSMTEAHPELMLGGKSSQALTLLITIFSIQLRFPIAPPKEICRLPYLLSSNRLANIPSKSIRFESLFLRGGSSSLSVRTSSSNPRSNKTTPEKGKDNFVSKGSAGPMCTARTTDQHGRIIMERPVDSWAAVVAAAAAAAKQVGGKTAAIEDEQQEDVEPDDDETRRMWAGFAAKAADDLHMAEHGANMTIIEFRRAAADAGGILTGARCRSRLPPQPLRVIMPWISFRACLSAVCQLIS